MNGERARDGDRITASARWVKAQVGLGLLEAHECCADLDGVEDADFAEA
ncbi:hypothetical protein [Streptomyces sp. NPDC001642]